MISALGIFATSPFCDLACKLFMFYDLLLLRDHRHGFNIGVSGEKSDLIPRRKICTTMQIYPPLLSYM